MAGFAAAIFTQRFENPFQYGYMAARFNQMLSKQLFQFGTGGSFDELGKRSSRAIFGIAQVGQLVNKQDFQGFHHGEQSISFLAINA
jgi:hypothetical protein